MAKKGVEYFKVLGEGLRTHGGFQWKPGLWNEEPLAEKDGEACGVGLHVFIGRPNWNYTRYIPDHTYRVLGVQGKCGSDKEKARFRRVKLAAVPMTLNEILGENRDGLKGSYLNGADLHGADLSEADLSSTDLTGADLSRALLIGTNLFSSELMFVDLSNANLYAVDLSYATLAEANLYKVNLSEANLTGVDLNGANLSWAYLNRANLSFAHLFRVDLTGANLSEANFTGAHGCKDRMELTKEQREQAHC